MTGQLQIDANGDGVTDITLNMAGLTAATQLSAADVLGT